MKDAHAKKIIKSAESSLWKPAKTGSEIRSNSIKGFAKTSLKNCNENGVQCHFKSTKRFCTQTDENWCEYQRWCSLGIYLNGVIWIPNWMPTSISPLLVQKSTSPPKKSPKTFKNIHFEECSSCQSLEGYFLGPLFLNILQSGQNSLENWQTTLWKFHRSLHRTPSPIVDQWCLYWQK